MALTTLDPKTALVLIDLQHGIVAPPAVPRSGAEVVARQGVGQRLPCPGTSGSPGERRVLPRLRRRP